MKWKKIIKVVSIFILLSYTVAAQHKKKRKNEKLDAYREFAQLSQWYLGVPLQMNVHFLYKDSLALSEGDSMETDMELFYGEHDFYMKTEGMEQIANDSLMLMVNNEAGMINLYQNDGQLIRNMKKMITNLTPDSSLEKLATKFEAKTTDEGNGIARITLESRDKITNTSLVKETIKITYDVATHQPITYDQSKLSLLPVDSVLYNQLTGNERYTGRLVNVKTEAGNLFFMVKEKITRCSFSRITHDQLVPPVREQDRVLKEPDGVYKPVKGFENYLVSKEF